jgi:hypothetical protein
VVHYTLLLLARKNGTTEWIPEPKVSPENTKTYLTEDEATLKGYWYKTCFSNYISSFKTVRNE